nr:dethiobiotin synthase [Oceanococcus sp. HetDA_MAG_MS8]
MPIVFVGGTDTEIGKTYTSLRLIHALRETGASVAGYKPVAAGCEQSADGWRNEDALKLLAASSPGLSYAQVNPIALPDAIAPHLAADNCGLRIDPDGMAAGAHALAQEYDWVIVEGAGGLLVPLTDKLTFLDWVAGQGWPCVLVVGMRLGCINHALLSAQALQKAGLPWAWIANRLPPLQPWVEENEATLNQWLAGPRLHLDQNHWRKVLSTLVESAC